MDLSQAAGFRLRRAFACGGQCSIPPAACSFLETRLYPPETIPSGTGSPRAVFFAGPRGRLGTWAGPPGGFVPTKVISTGSPRAVFFAGSPLVHCTEAGSLNISIMFDYRQHTPHTRALRTCTLSHMPTDLVVVAVPAVCGGSGGLCSIPPASRCPPRRLPRLSLPPRLRPPRGLRQSPGGAATATPARRRAS